MTEMLTIRFVRPVEITPDKLAQQKQYLADQERLAKLAQALEAEGQPSGDEARWEIAAGGCRISCRLNLVTRRMLIIVLAGAESITVLRDDDEENFVYNCPAGARWLDFLINQHDLVKAQREVLAAQKLAAERAAEIKRQGLI